GLGRLRAVLRTRSNEAYGATIWRAKGMLLYMAPAYQTIKTPTAIRTAGPEPRRRPIQERPVPAATGRSSSGRAVEVDSAAPVLLTARAPRAGRRAPRRSAGKSVRPRAPCSCADVAGRRR